MSIARADWPRLLSLVEQALEQPVADREAWLQSLSLPAALRSALQGLLAQRRAIETDDFLGGLPRIAAPPVGRLQAGAMVGPWRLLREIGQGGMSSVWLAERADQQLTRQVALKLPHAGPGQDLLAARLLRERNILAALEHRNIARLYDVGLTDTGTPYLVMEYVAGDTLLTHADRQRLDIPQRLALFQQVLRAVQYAHGQLVLHRDLKPGNILVNAAGDVKLLDFGIAKLLAGEGHTRDETELTRAAGRVLTPAYASPEQLRGEPLGTASDVYSLGVILYELLCAQRPHEVPTGGSAARLEDAVLHTEAKPPSRRTDDPARRRQLSGDLDAITLKAVAKDADRRYASVDALGVDLAHWLAGEPVGARAPGTLYTLGKLVRRHRLGVGLGAAALAGLLALSTVAVLQGQLARREAARAIASRDFLLGIFSEADPEEALGRELSAKLLLERGRQRALDTLHTTPELQADLLGTIARAQMGVGDNTGAQDSFGRAQALYQQLDAPRPMLTMLLGQVDNALSMYRLEEAKTLLGHAEALVARHRLGAEPAREVERMSGFVAMFANQPKVSQAAFERYLQRPAAELDAQPKAHSEVLAALADVLARQGERERAQDLIQQAMRLLAKHPELPPKATMYVEQYRLSIDYEWGRFSAIREWLPASIVRCEQALGQRSRSCLHLTSQLLRALLKLGRHAEAVSLLPALQALGDDRDSPLDQVQAQMAMARVWAISGNVDALQPLIAPLSRIDLNDDPQAALDPQVQLLALNTLAEVMLYAGRPADALAWVERGQARARRSNIAASREALKTRLFEGLARQQMGQHERALIALAPFCEAIEQPMGPRKVLDYLFGLNCARSWAATGRVADAMAHLDRSIARLRDPLGDDAPVLDRARRLRAALSRGGASEAGAADFAPFT